MRYIALSFGIQEMREWIERSSHRSEEQSDLILVLLGILMELALVSFWAFSGVWRGSWRLTVGFFIPGIVYLLTAWFVLKGNSGSISRRTQAILLGFTSLFLATFLFTPQPVSNDLYRYFWDGKLLAEGINPYAYPPDAVELAPHRDGYWPLIFNRDIPTGYPPLAEMIFAASYRLSPYPWLLRLFAALGVLLTSTFLMQALRISGKDPRRVILFAWSPLVILEFANSAHLDIFALAFMGAALVLALRGKESGSAACLALGSLTKFFPMLLLPLWGRRWGKKAWLVFALVFILPWLPFLSGGTPFKGLGFFASQGEVNSSLYRVIEWVWASFLNPEAAYLPARLTVAGLIAGIYGYGVFFSKRTAGVLSSWRFVGFIYGLLLLFSPVVHPWYLCWMLAFITLDGPTVWLVPSMTIIFARWAYIGYEQAGIWEEPWWLPLAVWAPFYIILAGKGWRTLKTSWDSGNGIHFSEIMRLLH